MLKSLCAVLSLVISPAVFADEPVFHVSTDKADYKPGDVMHVYVDAGAKDAGNLSQVSAYLAERAKRPQGGDYYPSIKGPVFLKYNSARHRFEADIPVPLFLKTDKPILTLDLESKNQPIHTVYELRGGQAFANPGFSGIKVYNQPPKVWDIRTARVSEDLVAIHFKVANPMGVDFSTIHAEAFCDSPHVSSSEALDCIGSDPAECVVKIKAARQSCKQLVLSLQDRAGNSVVLQSPQSFKFDPASAPDASEPAISGNLSVVKCAGGEVMVRFRAAGGAGIMRANFSVWGSSHFSHDIQCDSTGQCTAKFPPPQILSEGNASALLTLQGLNGRIFEQRLDSSALDAFKATPVDNACKGTSVELSHGAPAADAPAISSGSAGSASSH